jgi:hypothetical protein
MYLESVPVWAHFFTGTGIQLCPYQYWHVCTLVQYKYGQIPLLVLTINDDHTGIGIDAFLVQYKYWHGTLPVLELNGACTGIGIFALLSNTRMGVGKSGSSSKVQKTDRLLGRTVHPQGHIRLLRRHTKSAQRGRE